MFLGMTEITLFHIYSVFCSYIGHRHRKYFYIARYLGGIVQKSYEKIELVGQQDFSGYFL